MLCGLLKYRAKITNAPSSKLITLWNALIYLTLTQHQAQKNKFIQKYTGNKVQPKRILINDLLQH